MNKKGQAKIIGLIIEFIVVFLILLAVGPVFHEATQGVPLGSIIRLLFPGPEDAALNFIKAFIGSGLITGITGKLI
ncbi:MAG: hypothetical protein ACOCU6_02950 [Nanoarchaeota archaeon]